MVASGTVNVTTMARCCNVAPNTPEPNILVVAINPDSTVVTATTGADGKASLALVEGASVTAVYPEDADHANDIRTYVGVKPNDNLTFGDAYYQVDQPIAGADGQMTVSWTAVTDATRYYVYTQCSSTGSITGLTTSMPLYTYCQTATSPVAILALDDNSNILASVYLPAAASTVGATVNITAGQWVAQPLDNVALSISGLDPVVSYVDLRSYGEYPHFYWDDYDSPSVKSGVASATQSIPSTAPLKYARANLERNGNFGDQDYYKGGQPPFALAQTSLPWIENQALVSFSSNRAVWFETPGNYDAAVLYLDWNRSDKKQNHDYHWTIILPPKVADFRFPTPPAELEAFLPTAKDFVGHDLNLVDLSSAADYDAARALPEWRLSNAEGAVINGDEPSVGIASDGEGFTFSD